MKIRFKYKGSWYEGTRMPTLYPGDAEWSWNRFYFKRYRLLDAQALSGPPKEPWPAPIAALQYYEGYAGMDFVEFMQALGFKVEHWEFDGHED